MFHDSESRLLARLCDGKQSENLGKLDMGESQTWSRHGQVVRFR